MNLLFLLPILAFGWIPAVAEVRPAPDLSEYVHLHVTGGERALNDTSCRARLLGIRS